MTPITEGILTLTVKGTGVTVIALCPGATRTGFQARAHVGHTRLLQMGTTSAAQVADVGYRALHKGRTTTVPGLVNQLMAFSVRFLPRPLAVWAAQVITAPASA